MARGVRRGVMVGFVVPERFAFSPWPGNCAGAVPLGWLLPSSSGKRFGLIAASPLAISPLRHQQQSAPGCPHPLRRFAQVGQGGGRRPAPSP